MVFVLTLIGRTMQLAGLLGGLLLFLWFLAWPVGSWWSSYKLNQNPTHSVQGFPITY